VGMAQRGSRRGSDGAGKQWQQGMEREGAIRGASLVERGTITHASQVFAEGVGRSEKQIWAPHWGITSAQH